MGMGHESVLLGSPSHPQAVLYHGDALEIIPTLTADCIVTDPPYKLTSGGKSGLMRGIFDPAEYSNDGGIVPCDIDWIDFMPPLFKILRDPAHAYFMANNRNIQAMLNTAEESGFHFHNLLVWDKISAVANRWYMKNCEFIGFFSKGNAFQINDCGQKSLIRCAQVDESGDFTDNKKPHPTEKPVSLMQSFIENSTQKGETVLDPFMGSGTTGIAALKSGRKFIGIEKDKRFFDMAHSRLARFAESRQEELFAV